MDKIKVSVVIPVYNVEKYLEECLHSIVNQTLREIEIICVNDGSTDGSPEILQKYEAKDDRIIVCTQENRGVSAARNSGVARAQGKYLYFIDSDDILEQPALEILYEKAETDNLDVAYFNGIMFSEDPKYKQLLRTSGNPYIRHFTHDGVHAGHELLSKMARYNEYSGFVSLQFINRDFFVRNKLKFYEGIIYEDHLFGYECMLNAGRVEYLPLLLWHYRRHSDSITTKKASFAGAYGYFICYLAMSRFYNEQNLARFGDEMLFLPIEQTLNVFKFRYLQLPPAEKQKFFSLPNDQRQVFEACVPKSRIWLPRKVRGGLICLRNHGFIYTAKLIFWKIKYRK